MSPDSHLEGEEDSPRRFSGYNSFQEMLNTGGRNSLNNFASSYSRSANFLQADFDVGQRPKRLSMATVGSEETPLFEDSLYPTLSYNAIEEETDARSVRTAALKNTGNSTAPQTIFNGINTLIGIGILSLPLGMRYAGWIPGSVILLACALSTQYTAKLLAKCLQKNDELMTYGDIAQYCLGNIAHFIIVATFTVDLLSAGISMIVIFADSFNALTGVDKLVFKIIISFLFFLFSFLRLDILSHLSLLGILCTTLIVFSVIICGLFKTDGPGSLLHPSPTSLWPQDAQNLFLSLGIFMSPFGGHAIFPELYRDMVHPKKYNRSVSTIFGFTWSVDFAMAGLGYLMFGEAVLDEITKSIMVTPGFPQWINVVICALMGILPVSKGPLITRPIITMLDQYTSSKTTYNKLPSSVIRAINRFVIVLIFFITSLVFTDFGRIMSFLGSAICFAICIIYPLTFYLIIYYDELSVWKITATVVSIIISVILAVCGTTAVALV